MRNLLFPYIVASVTIDTLSSVESKNAYLYAFLHLEVTIIEQSSEKERGYLDAGVIWPIPCLRFVVGQKEQC